MKILSVILPIQPAKRAEFAEYVRRTQESAKHIAGCVTARWSVALDDPNTFHLFEVRESEEAYNRHLQSEAFQQTVQRYPEWLAGAPSAEMYTGTPAETA